MATSRKVVILGVDGADPGYYRKWMDAGLTPNFARLAARGRMGILQSTYPPVTAPAWTSFMTGEQPGSHGIVGFSAPSTGEYARKVVNSGSIESPLLWEIAGDRGADCIVVNVPLTYPLRRMNGVLVAGMLTPDGVGFTWPKEFEAELKLIQPDYQIDLLWQDYQDRGIDLVRDQKEMTRARAELCVKLLESRPWDLFTVVFTGTDRIQHCLHEHVEKIHDESAVRKDTLTAAVRDYFVSLDDWVGDIMKAAGEDTHFIVMSDHGFGRVEQSVYFNRWLADAGFLSLRTGEAKRLQGMKRVLNAVGIRRSTLSAAGRAVGLGAKVDAQVEKLNPFTGGIHWDRTRAYYYPTNGFFVNLQGREMFGTVKPGAEYEQVRDDLIAALEALKDPRTGGRLIPVVRRREELFAGRNMERLPDVFIEFMDQPFDAFLQNYDHPEVFYDPGWMNGTHRRNGLYIGAGPELAEGAEVEDLEIFDIAPNVLHLLGQSIPEHMDGRLRQDLFAEPARRDPQYEPVLDSMDRREGITSEEEKELEERLKGLGYL
ncbi:MAG: alkaline phosphatase family protein [Gemmatimonadota bacterium]|jgi:predicted AlkP superfamily phosphohydrolase/phosphomutase|nr:alkaline phosphatase family protein [Gemmatimonadota bacterium]MDP6528681.1 alkaline phosphatase family protein [Gemmatimonadota bacterium]MDP6802693.1 alkaline phosphatase family protein [Gemmatimonadota bacterium]MDP7031692.1 alkaline phosphatase family protein [Gemmatimonadota bacterium]